MKLKFKILFKNGKTKVYKSKHIKNCDEKIEELIETTKTALHNDISGKITVYNNIIRYSDISAIQIKKVWF